MLARQPLGEDGAGKAGADDQIIVCAPIAGSGARGHSAATSSAGWPVAARVPSNSATRPAMRACVVSQLVADSIRSASASQPLSGLRDSSSASSQAATNSSGSRGDLHALELAVVADHVLDRGRHDRLAAGEIFGGLGRRDELGRFVHRERHQRDVPARQIGRQLGVGLAAEIMDVGPLRQVVVADLDHRADHHERPVRAHRGDLVEQLGIEALVDHAVEAEARPRQVFLVGGVELPRARLGEMRAVDRRREAVDVARGGPSSPRTGSIRR